MAVLMSKQQFSARHRVDRDWLASIGDADILALEPGDRGTTSGYEATVLAHYCNGLYEVRVPGGVVCISARDFVLDPKAVERLNRQESEAGAVYLRKERREGGPSTWTCEYITGSLPISRAPFESLVDAINRAIAPAGLSIGYPPTPGVAMTGPTLPEVVLEASDDERLFLVHAPIAVPSRKVSVEQWRASRVDPVTLALTEDAGEQHGMDDVPERDAPRRALHPTPGG